MSLFLALLLLRRRRSKTLTLQQAGKTTRKGYRISRMALIPADSSPWQFLYNSQSDDALIVVPGFNHSAFDKFGISPE